MSKSEIHGASWRRRKILQNHKRVGKRFIPPFLHQIGPLSEVSWVDEMMPELIWIALLIDGLGYRRGVDLALQLSKAATNAHETDECEFFAWISGFNLLSKEEWRTVVGNLRELDVLPEIVHALDPLLLLFPNSPLAPFADDISGTGEDRLEAMKSVVQELYPRRDVFATRVQSTAVYFAFVADCLKVVKGTALADFPEVENYPSTDTSQKVAASVRASLNFLYGIARDNFSMEWPVAFWNRGLELDECKGLSEYWDDEQGQEDG